MADCSATDRILAEFSPPLDSALVYAILSDFAKPLSLDDQHTARNTLQKLAAVAGLADDTLSPDPHSSSLPHSHSHSGSEPNEPQPPRVERAELLALINQAHTELRIVERSPSSRGGGSGSRDTASTAASDLGSAIEQSSQDGSADPRASGGAAQRFWEQSAASFTSDEDGGARLVWDAPEGGFDLAVQDDPLAFLASVFPHIDLAQLEAKIGEVSALAPTQDGLAAHQPADLEALIEDLLSQDLITSLTEADADAAAAANAPAPDPDDLASMDRQQRRRVKAVHKAQQSFSLTSTPHVPYAQAAASVRTGPASALANAPLSTNAWASISSQATFLAACMHVSVARITSTYHAQGSSLARTIAALLAQLARERPFEALPSGPERKSELRLIVPAAKASDDHLEALLSASEGDLSDALDLHSFIGDLEHSLGTPLPLGAIVSSATAAPGAGSALALAPDGFTFVAARESPVLARAALPTPTPDRYTYEQCASLALEYLGKRNDAFRTAARSFQRGGVGERGAAGYWAEKGRELDRERRKWEERAARAAVTERRAKTGTNTVDLHGLTLAQALIIVDEACNTWWTNARDTLSPEPLRIVTGVGRHSRNGTPVLGPAVTKHLDREGWRWKWDDGPLVPGGLGAVNARGAVRVLGVAR